MRVPRSPGKTERALDRRLLLGSATGVVLLDQIEHSDGEVLRPQGRSRVRTSRLICAPPRDEVAVPVHGCAPSARARHRRPSRALRWSTAEHHEAVWGGRGARPRDRMIGKEVGAISYGRLYSIDKKVDRPTGMMLVGATLRLWTMIGLRIEMPDRIVWVRGRTRLASTMDCA